MYGYLEQRQRSHTGPATKEELHRLTKEGIRFLAERLGCTPEDLLAGKRPKVLGGSIEHFVLINDVRIALKIATSHHQADIVTWITDSEFKQKPLIVPALPADKSSKTKPQGLVPDGYFHLKIERNGLRTLHRFIEVDRGTETGISENILYRTWETKVNLYQQYYDSGEYKSRFKTHQMAILTVTNSDKRLANLKRITENAGGESWFWFTTFDRATSDVILTKPIWQLAGKEGFAPLVWEQVGEPPLS